jgi:GNAT superfamily N-acetyltransferase
MVLRRGTPCPACQIVRVKGLAASASGLSSMEMDCPIRPGTVEDAEQISAFINEVAADFIVCEFSQAGRDYFIGEHAPGKMRERLASGFQFFLAEQSGDLVGVSALRGLSHLHYLFVARRHQRRGLGRRLWRAVQEACLRIGYRGPITVNSSAYAVPVYERFGFVRCGPPQHEHGVVHYPLLLKTIDLTPSETAQSDLNSSP